MVPGVRGRLDEFFDDMGRGGEIGIAHPEVNDILPPLAGGELELVHGREHIGRQAGDSLKFVHRFPPAFKCTSAARRRRQRCFDPTCLRS